MTLPDILKHITSSIWDDPNTEYKKGQNEILEELYLIITGEEYVQKQPKTIRTVSDDNETGVQRSSRI
jgi:hypothetical protein